MIGVAQLAARQLIEPSLLVAQELEVARPLLCVDRSRVSDGGRRRVCVLRSAAQEPTQEPHRYWSRSVR